MGLVGVGFRPQLACSCALYFLPADPFELTNLIEPPQTAAAQVRTPLCTPCITHPVKVVKVEEVDTGRSNCAFSCALSLLTIVHCHCGLNVDRIALAQTTPVIDKWI